MNRSFSVLFILAMLTMAACSRKKAEPNLLEKIPHDAVGILMVNIGQLHQKANVPELLKNENFRKWMEGMKAEESDLTKKLIENPEEIGIYLSKLYAFSRINPDLPNGQMFHLMMVGLKDKATWEKVLAGVYERWQMPFSPRASETGGYQYVQWTGDTYWAWNDELLCMAGSFSKTNNSLPELTKFFEQSAKKKDEKQRTIAEHEEFRKLHDAGRDLLVWWNPDAQIDQFFRDKRASREFQGYLFLIGLSSEMLKGSHFALWYDFKNGMMESGIHYRTSPALKETLGGLFKSKQEIDFAPYFPKIGLAAVQTLALNPVEWKNILSKNRMDLPANMWLGGLGLNVNVLAEGLGGDFIWAAYLPSDEELTKITGDEEEIPGLDGVVGISVKNKEMADKVLSVIGGVTGARIVKNANSAELQFADAMPFHAVMTDKMLLISSRLSIARQMLSGGYDAGLRLEESYMKPLRESVGGMYLDHRANTDGLGAAGLGLAMSGLVNPIIADILAEYNELKTSLIVFKEEDASAKIELNTNQYNALQRLLELSYNGYGDWSDLQEIQ